MEKTPLISVIMSVYNEERYLDEAIQSILTQTIQDFEFVIVNDASNDRSSAILEDHAKQDSRIRIITNSENFGLTKSLNRGLKESKGMYIARMDADDISKPERFKKQLIFFRDHQGYGVVGTWFEEIDGEGGIIRKNCPPVEHEEVRKLLIRYDPMAHPSLMIRKEVFDRIGGYNEEWKYAQEYELYFRVLKHGYRMANIPEFLFQWRRTKKAVTYKNSRGAMKFVIKAQKKAIREGLYGRGALVYLLRSYIAYVIPVSVKRFVKRTML